MFSRVVFPKQPFFNSLLILDLGHNKKESTQSPELVQVEHALEPRPRKGEVNLGQVAPYTTGELVLSGHSRERIALKSPLARIFYKLAVLAPRKHCGTTHIT